MTARDWASSSLGDRIKYACEMRQWSLNRLGELASLESGPISKLSRRKERTAGSPETLIRLADALKVELRWLADGRGPIEQRDAVMEAGGAEHAPPGPTAASRMWLEDMRNIQDEHRKWLDKRLELLRVELTRRAGELPHAVPPLDKKRALAILQAGIDQQANDFQEMAISAQELLDWLLDHWWIEVIPTQR